jgi:hypothetical protein
VGLPRRLGRGLLTAALGALGACALGDPLERAFGPDGRTIRRAIEEFPPERRAEFDLVRDRCGRCHSLDPVFAARVPEGGWAAQVRTMARKAGAGIAPAEAARIASFLEYFEAERRKAAAPAPAAP